MTKKKILIFGIMAAALAVYFLLPKIKAHQDKKAQDIKQAKKAAASLAHKKKRFDDIREKKAASLANKKVRFPIINSHDKKNRFINN